MRRIGRSTRFEKEAHSERLQSPAFWLAFSTVVAVLWAVLPTSAGAGVRSASAGVTDHACPFQHHNKT